MPAPNRILIVDDDADVHRLLAAALASPERQVESVFAGLQGLERVEAFPFDLVMTVASTPEHILHAIRERAFAYFSKPFTLSSVLAMVDWALASTAGDDDIEVLSARPDWVGLRVRCKLETADRILQFLHELSMDLPSNEKEDIAAAFREILVNAIEHGGGSDPEKRVTITYVRTARAILYYVRDPGKGFNFEDLSHAAVSNSDESPLGHVEVRERMGIRPGGFGILMTRRMVDELIYNESGNEVMLIKYLGA